MFGELEIALCDFCDEEKQVERTYLKPSKYVKPKDPKDHLHLNNEGNYFVIIYSCKDCGPPKLD